MEDNRRRTYKYSKVVATRRSPFLPLDVLVHPSNLSSLFRSSNPLKVVIQSLSLSQIHRKPRDDGGAGAGPIFSVSCHLSTLGLRPSFNEVISWSAVLVLRRLPDRRCFSTMSCLPCSLWPGLVQAQAACPDPPAYEISSRALPRRLLCLGFPFPAINAKP